MKTTIGYQSLDDVSSVITTKVKGQGFVPLKNQSHLFRINLSDSNYERLFTINPELKYRILDTAGIRYFLSLKRINKIYFCKK